MRALYLRADSEAAAENAEVLDLPRLVWVLGMDT